MYRPIARIHKALFPLFARVSVYFRPADAIRSRRSMRRCDLSISRSSLPSVHGSASRRRFSFERFSLRRRSVAVACVTRTVLFIAYLKSLDRRLQIEQIKLLRPLERLAHQPNVVAPIAEQLHLAPEALEIVPDGRKFVCVDVEIGVF